MEFKYSWLKQTILQAHCLVKPSVRTTKSLGSQGQYKVLVLYQLQLVRASCEKDTKVCDFSFTSTTAGRTFFYMFFTTAFKTVQVLLHTPPPHFTEQQMKAQEMLKNLPQVKTEFEPGQQCSGPTCLTPQQLSTDLKSILIYVAYVK